MTPAAVETDDRDWWPVLIDVLLRTYRAGNGAGAEGRGAQRRCARPRPKAELGLASSARGERLKANAAFMLQAAPDSRRCSSARPKRQFRAALQKNMVVLATFATPRCRRVSRSALGDLAPQAVAASLTALRPHLRAERQTRPAARRQPRAVTQAQPRACRDLAEPLAQPRERTASPPPIALCRNRRMVGYQGVSVRSSIHRKSGANGTKSPTALAIAPARCATEVSTAMTRSSIATTAAVVSEKSPQLLALLDPPMPWRRIAACAPRLRPRCRLTKSTPDSESIVAKRSSGIERLRSVHMIAASAQHMSNT